MVELKNRGIEYNFISSGQHKETMDDILNNFSLRGPDITLYKGRDITSIFQMIIWGIQIIVSSYSNKKKLWKNDPSGIILNHGDTFSTLLGSLIGKLHGIKTAHIESGLRSFNLFHPFPEEITRIITFYLTDFYFTPGEKPLDNLKKFKGTKINTQLNTLYDSLRLTRHQKCDIAIPKSEYGIVSIHRFENIFNKKRLEQVIELIEHTAVSNKLIFILHKPTLNKLEKFGLLPKLRENKNIELRPRYSYFDFIHLLRPSKFILTDGGSNQEECSYLGKPCFLMRLASEREEGIGKNALIGEYKTEKLNTFLNNIKQFTKPEVNTEKSPTTIIVDHLQKLLSS
ncbi:MAG: UDP-N-acetyl glucosamine 2-epimerase [Cellvibrionaceae bacterium]